MRKILFVCLFSISTQALAYGEFYFSTQWGGTTFNDSVGPYDHKRSWDFGKNAGISLGFKGGIQSDLFTLGIGGEWGWKEDSFERVGGGGSAHYYYQMTRLLAGAFLALSPTKKGFHFYFGYDPLVMSQIHHSKVDAANPFQKDDRFKGKGYSIGFGFERGDFLTRLLGRRIVYNEVDFSGTKRTLPDGTYSELTTDEFVVQFGSTF